MQFGRKQAQRDNAVEGKTFLANAKRDHAALFADFVQRDDEFESLEDYVESLQSAAWQLCEAVAKQSYRNGIARGKGSRE